METTTGDTTLATPTVLGALHSAWTSFVSFSSATRSWTGTDAVEAPQALAAPPLQNMTDPLPAHGNDEHKDAGGMVGGHNELGGGVREVSVFSTSHAQCCYANGR